MQPQIQIQTETGPQIATQVQVEDPRNVRWRLATRIAFRFVFIYFLLYNFPFPLNYIPYAGYLGAWYDPLWHRVVPWVGVHVLRLSYAIKVLPNGSGDTTFSYVRVLSYLILAVVATAIWSVLDGKRTSYEKAYSWLKLYVRLVLGAALISYGATKLIPVQMPTPFLSTLVESYGESSPMRLLWTFMGASQSYESFAGAAEMLAGILLFIPRCTALGALIAMGVLSNVFMLNMSYDVPVKQYSFHLLLMAVFLAAPDLRRLAGLFLLKRKVELSATPPFFRRRWLNRGILVLQLAFALFFVVTSLQNALQWRQELREQAAPSPYYGVWSVEEYAVDGTVKLPLLTDATRWQRVIFERSDSLLIQSMTGKYAYFRLQLDPASKSLTLGTPANDKWKSDFKVDISQPDLMILQGQMNGHQITAKLRRMDSSKFLLTNRGFHWINEYPYNR